MRKKIISVILAAAMVCSNMVAVNAAEVTGETPEVIQEETVEEEVPQESRASGWQPACVRSDYRNVSWLWG